MNIFLDDVRCPDWIYNNLDWTICRTAEETISLLCSEEVKFISFDHDLGEELLTGYDVAKFIEEQVFLGKMKPPEFKIHSANPIGAERIKQAMENAWKYYKMRK